MDCNPHSRTSYYTTSFTLFTLPAAIVVYVLGIRGLLWVLRPALLFVRPQLKGHALFSHDAHLRTNALCIDVRTAHFPMPRGAFTLSCLLVRELGCVQVRCVPQVTIGLAEVRGPTGESQVQ